MRRATIVVLGVASGLLALAHPGAGAPPSGLPDEAQLIHSYGELPLAFEANLGQVAEPEVRFLSRGRGSTLFLKADEAVLALAEFGPRKSKFETRSGLTSLLRHDRFLRAREARLARRDRTLTVLRMKLVGASPQPQVSGLDELPGKSNYFLGNDPAHWVTNVTRYAKVRYQDVYPGVDLVYYGQERQLEYDFVVSPGGDPGAIKLAIRVEEGAPPLHIDARGDLVISTGGGEVRLRKPAVYQPAPDRELGAAGGTAKSFIDGRYVLGGENQVSFELAPYDARRPLVIDPLLSYSTYLGGGGSDLGTAVAVDSTGNAYVTGYTLSTSFPTTSGTFQTNLAGGSLYGDVFVTKLNAAGSALVYSTYLGGGDEDAGTGIAVDASGNAYVTGYTRSANFPTTSGAFRTAPHGGTCGPPPSIFSCGDAFVSKLNPAGSSLVYSTYLGGSQDDWAYGIALDSFTNAYVTGYSESTDFPTTAGAFEPKASGGICGADPCPETFVTKLNGGGTALVYSTYLGGIGGRGYGIALDSSGNAYVTGSTDSPSFPTTPGAVQTGSGGNGDAFVVKLKPDSSGLVYSTYLGGQGVDAGTAVALDASGDAYVTGLTSSFNFPATSGALQATCGGCAASVHDAFVTKLDPTGSTLVYSTFLGGSNDDLGFGIAVDSAGDVYVAGQTLSTDFPTANAVQGQCGGCGSGFSDAFVSRLNTTGSTLVYSTYLGGSGSDVAYAIALDSAANAYVTGSTSSADFLTTLGVYQTAPGGALDAFVTKIDPPVGAAAALSSTALTFAGQPVNTSSPPESVTLQNVGNLPLAIQSVSASGDYSESDTCGTSVAPGSTCAISVTFTPTTAGPRTGAISITDNSLGGPQSISLSGSGISVALVNLSATQISFGSQLVGTSSSPQTVNLSDAGGLPLTITSLTTSSDFTETNTCGASVAAGATCTISITFTPTATGTRTGSLAITDNAATSPQVISLSGAGIAPAASLSSASLTFADQSVGTSSAAQTITLTNGGSATLTISSLAVSGGFAETSNCGTSVAPGANCSLNVTFVPTASGPRSGALTITDNAGGSPQTVALAGNGVVAYQLSASSALATVIRGVDSAKFAISASSPSSFTGGINLACSGNAPADCAFNPASIQPGQTATLTVSNLKAVTGNSLSFTVTGTSGQQSFAFVLDITLADFSLSASPATLSVTAGQSSTSTLTIMPIANFAAPLSFNCSGAPLDASCSVSPASLTPNGSSASQVTLTVTTAARSRADHRRRFPVPDWPPGAFGILACAWLSFLWARLWAWLRREQHPNSHWAATSAKARGRSLRLAVALILLAAMAACGGGGGAPPAGRSGTPAGSYPLNVTGTYADSSVTLNHSTTVTLNVN